MTDHDQWRPLSRRLGEIFILGRIEKSEGSLAICGWKLDRLRFREVAILNDQVEAALYYSKFIRL